MKKMATTKVLRFHRTPLLSDAKSAELTEKLRKVIPEITRIETEQVIYVETDSPLSTTNHRTLRWLLRDKHQPKNLKRTTFFSRNGRNILEFGPRLNFETADSTNAVAICQSCGIKSIERVEQARRYWIILDRPLTKHEQDLIAPLLHDKMTECLYLKPLQAFKFSKKLKRSKPIPVMENGIEALKKANEQYGAGMDDVDLEYYRYLFVEVMKRNPTVAEFRDLGNTNSEHSRHHVFRAKLIIDGKEVPFTLMELVQGTLKNRKNSMIAYHDNASAIYGFSVSYLIPERPGMPSPMRMAELLFHLVLTCETHNHPCLWCAYQGAGTGGGGRRRDSEAPGRGGIVVAGSAGFMGGNLNIAGYELPWEDKTFSYDPRTESPLNFFIRATKGAFDDGNQFGEPVILTFAESFGMIIGDKRWEFVKPVMFSGGFSIIDARHVEKAKPKEGWLVVKIGGLAYRVGVGGGSASSMMQGESTEDLDFNSVQRANGEMANKADRVLRACILMGERNPIKVIHDQGAGGNGNVLKEIVNPQGAVIRLRSIPLGDPTLTDDEIMVAEYQENLALLIEPDRWEEFAAICEREKVHCAAIGVVSHDSKFVVVDEDSTVVADLDL
ncbi:MAG: AIR synthase-related protein, partial [Patescibacteria group bacterium]